ncbi:hypothetical protein [Mesorhizobium sp. M0910]|uniref:hypothetical protein n=1 Tax=Mesorhizobium sp. M0910 TaxID=2957025 RepID=UPI00333D4EE9
MLPPISVRPGGDGLSCFPAQSCDTGGEDIPAIVLPEKRSSQHAKIFSTLEKIWPGQFLRQDLILVNSP